MPSSHNLLLFTLLIVVLLTIAGYLLAKPINLVTADLGRHIVNGTIVVESGSIPQGNRYSYTHPDFPFINHHWGSGVIFYFIHQWGGFNALSIVYLLLMLAAVGTAFTIAANASSPLIAALAALPAIPLIATRGEVRPEAFSYLLIVVFLMILWRYRARAGSEHSLAALPLLMVLWVNLHLFFIVGIGIIGAFFLDALVSGPNEHRKNLGATLIITALATLLNPMGIDGATLPLTITQEYGYRVLENQTLGFIETFAGKYPPALFYKILAGALLGSWIVILWRRAWSGSIAKTILSVAFAGIAWFAIRNLAIFAIVSIPVIASNLAPLQNTRAGAWLNRSALMLPLITVMAFGLYSLNPAYFTNRPVGIGLIPGIKSAAQFIETTSLRGPYFNNYDIGGYLIYALYPKERVFVDNRPEAYPVAFFENTYIPMQTNNTIWEEQIKEHQFNAVVFYRHEQTEWGQTFLATRINDPAWAPVYVDGASIIFARRGGPNQQIIDQFELPRSMFTVRH